MGPSLLAGCDDAALVQVDVRDANGLIDPTATLPVTFSVQGTAARLVGTANGDPADHTINTSPVRPAYHGRVMAVFDSWSRFRTCTSRDALGRLS
jgi:beta-galactosidase